MRQQLCVQRVMGGRAVELIFIAALDAEAGRKRCAACSSPCCCCCCTRAFMGRAHARVQFWKILGFLFRPAPHTREMHST
jgi:hypothetical protein